MNNRDWFEITDTGIVKLKTETKAIPEIKELLKTKDSDKYWQYIWHLCAHKSPYASFTEIEREEKVREDFLKEAPSKTLLKVVEQYRATLETTSMRLLRASKNAALSLAEYLEKAAKEGIEPEERKEVVDTLGKIGKIIESLDKLEEKVKKEISNDDRLRGGGQAGSRER